MNEQGTPLNEEKKEQAPFTTEQTYLICGCTWTQACEGGCYWLLPGICSKCVTREVPECMELLVELVLEDEYHLAEVEAGNHKEDTCSTCGLIKLAQKMVGALRQ